MQEDDRDQFFGRLLLLVILTFSPKIFRQFPLLHSIHINLLEEAKYAAWRMAGRTKVSSCFCYSFDLPLAVSQPPSILSLFANHLLIFFVINRIINADCDPILFCMNIFVANLVRTNHFESFEVGFSEQARI